MTKAERTAGPVRAMGGSARSWVWRLGDDSGKSLYEPARRQGRRAENKTNELMRGFAKGQRENIQPIRSEFVEQVQIVNWIWFRYGDSVLFTASAGGMRTTIGVAHKMKLMGYSKGTPDLFIAEPRGKYHGLFIEVKREKGGTVTAEQKKWLAELNRRGYLALIARGYNAATQAITDYLK